MYHQKNTKNVSTLDAEYLVVGAGPAAICAVAKLYGSGIPGDKIIWVDSQFKVGDFGTTLSAGSSVPGNTAVENYRKVNDAIYALVPECKPTSDEQAAFEMTSLAPDITCSLKVAAEPLQHITKKLRQLVRSIEGSVQALYQTKNGIQANITSADDASPVLAKRVILAVGAQPRTLPLPDHIAVIDPNTAFIESELRRYISDHPTIKTVAVIGSSHSAALATMHLLQAGIAVKQFMNKEYKFATPAIAADGTRYTQFDNTGLKGEVAQFTRQLLSDDRMREMWECHIGENVDTLLATHLPECTHAVVCIGYKPSCSLLINDAPLMAFKYDRHSTEMMSIEGEPISGVFGIGVAYPPEVKAISGEVEPAVGVGKFWASINERILTHWKNHPAPQLTCSATVLRTMIVEMQRNGLFNSNPKPAEAAAASSIAELTL